jgi:Putative addiction module component
MAATVNDIFEEVLLLSPLHRANLAEKIVESIETDIIPEIELQHIEEIERRKNQVFSDGVKILSGDEVLRSARSLIQK